MRKLGITGRYEYDVSDHIYWDVEIDDTRRYQHIHVIGKSGTGKSSFMENLAYQDIQAGEGVIFLDPHGHSVKKLANAIPRHRMEDVVYLDMGDTQFPVKLNVLFGIPEHLRPLMVQTILQTFKSLWFPDFDAPLIQMYLTNIMAALLDAPSTTLLDAQYMLTNDKHRKTILKHSSNPTIPKWWEEQYDNLNQRTRDEKTMSTLNKLNNFSVDPVMRNIVGQHRCIPYDLSKIYLINLNVATIGLSNASILGGLLLPRFAIEAMNNPTPCHLFIDELGMFKTAMVPEMLSTIRKFQMSMTLAHQYLEQLPDATRDSLLGNAGTLVGFRCSKADSRILDLPELQSHQAIIRSDHGEDDCYMDNFTVDRGTLDTVRDMARHRYATPRQTAESRINRWIRRL